VARNEARLLQGDGCPPAIIDADTDRMEGAGDGGAR
jgi:hypothetical protein